MKLQSEQKKKQRAFNPNQDDKNWQELFNTQFQNLQSLGAISTMWMNGFSKLGLDNSKMPTADVLTKISKQYTGYTFIQTTESIIYEQIDWYRYIANYEMPLSGFLRMPSELAYCDEPDNWHEIIGHIPFLIDKEYSDMYQNLAKSYIKAYEENNQKALKILDFVGGLLVELALIREPSGLKAFGATLYSSGELYEAFKPENQVQFSYSVIEKESGYDRSQFQGRYYVIDSLTQVNEIIDKAFTGDF